MNTDSVRVAGRPWSYRFETEITDPTSSVSTVGHNAEPQAFKLVEISLKRIFGSLYCQEGSVPGLHQPLR